VARPPALSIASNVGSGLFITGGRKEKLDAAVRHVGRNVQAIRGDVSKLVDLERIMATVKEQKGNLDVPFANAGIATEVWRGYDAEAAPEDALNCRRHGREARRRLARCAFINIRPRAPCSPVAAATRLPRAGQ
jgi:NAD(P)-dependent dehydrogenase (short-subunit alcohol dehydrogenase family)